MLVEQERAFVAVAMAVSTRSTTVGLQNGSALARISVIPPAARQRIVGIVRTLGIGG